MKQTSFPFAQDGKKEFGGSLLQSKRKTARPLSPKKPLHLILKADHKNVFHPNNTSLQKLVREQTQKFGIKLYDVALNWSHIHFVILVQSRQNYQKFIRSLTSLLAVAIRKSKPNLKVIFTLRPFTRILNWGRDFRNTLKYLALNKLEALGLVMRDKKLKVRKQMPRACMGLELEPTQARRTVVQGNPSQKTKDYTNPLKFRQFLTLKSYLISP